MDPRQGTGRAGEGAAMWIHGLVDWWIADGDRNVCAVGQGGFSIEPRETVKIKTVNGVFTHPAEAGC